MTTIIKPRKGKITKEQYLELVELFDTCPGDCDMCSKLKHCEITFACLCNLRRATHHIAPGTIPYLRMQLSRLFGKKEAELCL